MKKLLFFLLLIPVLSFGQTANYTSLSSTDLEVYSVSDKTLVYEFYDTLSGSNDTLIISFPKEFAVDYTATLGSTWVSTGTTTDSDVFLQGRNASHETWTDLGTTTFAAETTTAYSDGIDVGGYLYYRLVCVSASGNAHLKNTLVLKKKVGSSASGGVDGDLQITGYLRQDTPNGSYQFLNNSGDYDRWRVDLTSPSWPDVYMSLDPEEGFFLTPDQAGGAFIAYTPSSFSINMSDATLYLDPGGLAISSTGGLYSLTNLPTYANDAAAGIGGLVATQIYKTATGELRIKL